MEPKKLLFVDDDERLLEGLKRILRKKRKEWEMFFAYSGEEALKVVAANDISIIVADMRMPGMDGAVVLQQVNAISPKTIRFILSGQASKELVLQTLRNAHIFLSKPCNQDIFLSALERAASLHDLIMSSEVQEVATKIGTLPSIPDLYQKLCDELNSDDPSIDRVGAIVASDPAMCTKILQVVNSAFFNLPRTISTPNEAASILGLDTLSAMLLVAQVFEQIDEETVNRFGFQNIWNHSHRTSAIAKAIARKEKLPSEQVNIAATVGLLHEIGRLLVAHTNPDAYAKVIETSRNSKISIEAAEQQIYNATTCEIGAYLLGLWGLPSEVIRGVAYYRKPSKDLDNILPISIATIVHVAYLFERDLAKKLDEPIENLLDVANLKEAGVFDKLPEWLEIARGALGAKTE